MLNTFVKPMPCIKTMNRLTQINRWLNLKGISCLKSFPILKHYVPARGLCDITHIEYLTDMERVKQKLENTVFFLAPNHPEFYTDWMLDKEISAQLAPEMAGWATHSIVNGLGKSMQKFWLKNNLIAQIPGAGNDAKEYSIEYALTGKGVLLHPEGKVNWHSDHIHKLYSGIVDMGYEALKRAEFKKEVVIVPILWKLKFNKNIDKELIKEIQYISKQLNINIDIGTKSISEQMKLLLQSIMFGIIEKYQLTIANYKYLSLHDLINRIRFHLITNLADQLQFKELCMTEDEFQILKKKIDKKVRSTENVNKEIKSQLKTLNQVEEMKLDVYLDKEVLTQEHLAEMLKKIRIQFCKKGLINKIHQFIPMPVSDRTAYIKIAPLVHLNLWFKENMTDSEVSHMKTEVLNAIQQTMQIALDSISPKSFGFHQNYTR